MQNKFTSYLKTTIFLSLIALVFSGAFFEKLINKGLLPPVTFSGNISLDEKLRWLKINKPFPADILAIGSSMTLNNLSTSTLVSEVNPGVTFLNLGVWGKKIWQTYAMFKFFEKRTNPHLVLLVTSPVDFYEVPGPELGFNPNAVNAYIDDSPFNPLLFLFYSADLFHLIKDRVYIQSQRQGKANYNNLNYDSSGGVALQILPNEIDQKRWNEKSTIELIDLKNYESLRQWVQSSVDKKICLIVAESPLKAGSVTAEEEIRLQEHYRNLKKILTTPYSAFIDLETNSHYNSSLFADYSHLNQEGSKIFTQALSMEMYETCARPFLK